MNRILVFVILVPVLCLALSNPVAAQSYLLQVMNQSVSGSDLVFDMFILRTSDQALYLADADLKLDFNTANFTSPTGPTETEGLNGFYTISSEITGGVFIVNILKPGFSTQPQFDARVMNISNTGSGDFIGRFHITGISNAGGSSGLVWRHPGNVASNGTVVTVLANETPWFQSNITSGIPSWYSSSDAPLPITLASFSASVSSENHVELTWKTVSEVNNYGFNVQRRNGSDGTFADIPSSFIAGHGTTTEVHEYRYVDVTAGPGKWYYRLKQTDVDGTIHYSDVAGRTDGTAIELKAVPTAFALEQNFPNPFNPSTTIRFALPKETRVELTAYNVLGQRVQVLVDEVRPAGFYEERFDASNFASGVYFYRIQAGNFVATKRFMVLK